MVHLCLRRLRFKQLTLLILLSCSTTKSISATPTQSQRELQAEQELKKLQQQQRLPQQQSPNQRRRRQRDAQTTTETPNLLSGFPNEWTLDRNHYSGPLLPPTSTPHRTCIIVQDSAPGPEAEVLDATSRVNRAYAKRWNHDYLKFTGVALGSLPWQATFNRPYLLSSLLMARETQGAERGKNSTDGAQNVEGREGEAQNVVEGKDGGAQSTEKGMKRSLQPRGDWHEGKRFLHWEDGDVARSLEDYVNRSGLRPYDTVLFLESNAMIVQLDYDVLDLIAKDKMLAMVGGSGAQIHKSKYSDVMLWNLEHPQAMSVANSWIETSQTNLYDEKANSQALLMNVLHNEAHELDGSDRADLLDPIPEPMVDGLQGTVIKQDSKYTKVVQKSDLPTIMPVVQGIADSVCYRFYPQCEVVNS